jgi:hypothetical protein
VVRFRRRSGSGDRADSTSSAVAKFAVGGLAALAAVGVGSYFLMRHIGTTEAIDNAKDVTRIVGRQIVEPRVTDGLLRERPSSIRRLDHVVQNNVLRRKIVRVKIWTGGGRIVYSDKHRLIGSRYKLGADDLAVLRGGGVDAGLSDLSRPENRFERSRGEVMEVYLPIHTPSGKPLLFETYQRFSSIASSGSSIWRAFAPALVGALLILALLQVPLAASMARRLRRGHAEREALLQRALDASDRERRRIAGDLHDGVVQDLAGTAFSLAAAAKRSNGKDNGGTREVLERRPADAPERAAASQPPRRDLSAQPAAGRARVGDQGPPDTRRGAWDRHKAGRGAGGPSVTRGRGDLLPRGPGSGPQCRGACRAQRHRRGHAVGRRPRLAHRRGRWARPPATERARP